MKPSLSRLTNIITKSWLVIEERRRLPSEDDGRRAETMALAACPNTVHENAPGLSFHGVSVVELQYCWLARVTAERREHETKFSKGLH